jgi:ankyrin repeat protein
MTGPTSRLPARPSLDQLRKQAKELLRLHRAADGPAVDRVRAVIVGAQTDIRLADAQFVIARELGFQNWAALAEHVEKLNPSAAPAVGRPPIRPAQFGSSETIALPDGGFASADTVWSMFLAAHAGDLDRVKALVARHPGIVRCEYNYTPPIHFAAREGHTSVVRFLLEHGANAAYKSYPFQDSLLTLAEDHEHAATARILREHLTRRFALADGMKTILEAARDGDIDRVRAEIAKDSSLARGSNDDGLTPIHIAANNGHLEIVRLLLESGSPVDPIMSDGFRPIHAALMPRGRHARPPRDVALAIVDLLLSRGAEYTIVIALLRGDGQYAIDALGRDPSLANFEDTCHRRPISIAAELDDLAMVNRLLAAGADPNLPEAGAPRGQALWTAVYHRRPEMARVLAEHGADPNAMVESSGTPLFHARKDPALFELLVRHGGRADVTDRERLGQLIDDNDLAGVDRFLTDHPELIAEDRAYWGEGMLAGPANGGTIEMLDLLIRHGARVPTVTKWGRYYYFKHTDRAAFLLDHGMDPNHMNWHYTTLLHHVAADGDIPKARLLLDHGADIDALDEEYRSTPLGMAARWGRTAMVAFLLERGADPNLAGAPWATPLAWARKKGHPEVEALSRGQTP